MLKPLPGTPADFWANKNELLRNYYEHDWGVPKRGDALLFELLTLEIFSSGLNWQMMLKKRASFQRVFMNYELDQIAAFGESDIARLLMDTSIVRNRSKIESVIANAQAAQHIQETSGSFTNYVWSFTAGEQLVLAPATPEEIPTQDDLSRRVSRQMKKDGFRFVGPVIARNFLQACGVIDDRIVPVQA